MNVIEKVIFTVAGVFMDPGAAMKDLRARGKEIGVKSMPYILALQIGVLITLCGFRYQQAGTGPVIDISEEPVVEEVIAEPAESEEERLLREEAEYCAKVLYGTAQYNSEAGQKLVVWCIANRVESDKYPNTVKEVCQQEVQWMGYSDDNPVLTNLYDISMGVLKQWHSGGYRDVSPDFIFMTWSSNEIVLKDRFEDNKKTHYWYE